MELENTVEDQGSIEDMTLESLTDSIKPLKQLLDTCETCADTIESGGMPAAIEEYKTITQQLHDFDIFQAKICQIFVVNGERVCDEKGNLLDLNDDFAALKEQLLQLLINDDLPATCRILREDAQKVISRYIDLLPLLKQEIERKILALT